MKLRLFLWLMRRLRPITTVAAAVACGWTLLVPGPLYESREWPLLFILAHSIAITSALGRFMTPQFAWLHGRGYSRAALWSHTMAAAGAGALAVWIPAALIVATPARSFVHDRLFTSPYYPIMQPRDAIEIWQWLWTYLALLPLMAYGWIRESQPTRGMMGGWLLVIAAIIAGFSMLNITRPGEFPRELVNGAYGLAALICLIAGRRLYRALEVRR
ncbi:MAG: hypothetical protein ABFD69_07545 [Candidatus Sumerlaeia bacterium]